MISGVGVLTRARTEKATRIEGPVGHSRHRVIQARGNPPPHRFPVVSHIALPRCRAIMPLAGKSASRQDENTLVGSVAAPPFIYSLRNQQRVNQPETVSRPCEGLLPGVGPDGRTSKDYAIVSTVFDSQTGELLIAAAGITQYGTRAAGGVPDRSARDGCVRAPCPAGRQKKFAGSAPHAGGRRDAGASSHSHGACLVGRSSQFRERIPYLVLQRRRSGTASHRLPALSACYSGP